VYMEGVVRNVIDCEAGWGRREVVYGIVRNVVDCGAAQGGGGVVYRGSG